MVMDQDRAAERMRSVFTETVGKYFVAKLLCGLLFLFSFCFCALALAAIAGIYHPGQGPIARSAPTAAIQSGILAAVGLVGYIYAEARRRAAKDRKKETDP
jgi:ABC-type transport system involved in multi-copper enzyme maturation permease subunit